MMLSAASWVLLSLAGLLDGFEEEVLRWRYRVRGEQSSPTAVVFVNVDANTVATMGDKPWDRLNFAQTIEALLGPGRARAVGVDIIFSPIGTGSLLDVERARQGDYRLGQVVDRYSDRLVLAVAYTGTSGALGRLPLRRYGYLEPESVPFPEAPIFPIIKSEQVRLGLANVDVELNDGTVPYRVPAIIETEGEGFSRNLIDGQLRYFNAMLNAPEVVVGEGVLQVVDADGFALDPVPARSAHRLLTLGLEVFLASHGLSPHDIDWQPDALHIHRNGVLFRKVPLVQGQSMEVNWHKGWDTREASAHYSMVDVLHAAHALGDAARRSDAAAVAEWEQWFERFRGKVVFIGATEATLKDLAPTPYNRAPVPKVGLHANIFRTLDTEGYIRESGRLLSSLLIVILSALVSGLLVWGGPGRLLTRSGSILLLLAYIGLVFYSFSRQGMILPMVAPVGASVFSALAVLLFRLGSEEYQRRRIKTLFGSYVSPSLVEDMVESQRDPELGGTEGWITALFSDVEGFSALSEELGPKELVALMNEYLGAMTETFQAEQGTLDKYIGDAIVTMFGMPYPVEDHAARACRSAIRMQERHAELREHWAREGKWPDRVLKMRTRIGINTGLAVIGNMGSEMRFNYTMMGDSVNLAARCESGAKNYGVYTMITEDTLKSALSFGERLNYRKLDRIIVKGRTQPVDIYELWDGTVDPAEIESCKIAYEAALELYFNADFAAALAGFVACASYEPLRSLAPTTPSDVLAARCREFIQRGTPEPWEGAYRMTSK